MRNCYALVCNAFEPDVRNLPPGKYCVGIPSPGQTGGRPIKNTESTDDVADALLADKFVFLPYKRFADIKRKDVPDGQYVIAATLDPKRDWHFYCTHISDPLGKFYQKPGWIQPVTDLDDSNNIIQDPRFAVRRCRTVYYKRFVGYFLAPRGGVKLNIEMERCDDDIESADDFFLKKIVEESRQFRSGHTSTLVL